jgi:hypothetical protein
VRIYESVHGIERRQTGINTEPAEEPRPPAIFDAIAGLDRILDEEEDSAEIIYQCMVEDCPAVCYDSRSIRVHERTHGSIKKADSSLKFMAIDIDDGIYFVRGVAILRYMSILVESIVPVQIA